LDTSEKRARSALLALRLRKSGQLATGDNVGRVESIVDSVCRERGAALMGVVNVTPDSFYDGGRFADSAAARERVDALVRDGATILDIGGESTRPGSTRVQAAEQLERITPCLEYAATLDGVLVSVDTADPRVAETALGLGAQIVNDVSCLANVELAEIAARHQAVLVVMHSRGPMSEMRGFSEYPERGYDDVVEDVRREWLRARERAIRAGMPESQIWFDPGIGFNKSARHSFELLSRLSEFRSLGVPIVVGASRKSFLSAADPAPPERRLGGTVAACLSAVARGAHVLRVHDVHDVQQALLVSREIARSSGSREAAHA
jgi:dihydropteroate synthase